MVVGLVGHSTNVVSDVAPWRVLETIGDGSLRSRGGAEELAYAVEIHNRKPVSDDLARWV